MASRRKLQHKNIPRATTMFEQLLSINK